MSKNLSGASMNAKSLKEEGLLLSRTKIGGVHGPLVLTVPPAMQCYTVFHNNLPPVFHMATAKNWRGSKA